LFMHDILHEKEDLIDVLDYQSSMLNDYMIYLLN